MARLLPITSCTIIFLALFCVRAADCLVSFNYSEVQKLGYSCPQRDSCGHLKASRSRDLFSIKEMNCACDYLCTEYGDCCIDANKTVVQARSSEYSCLHLKEFGGVFVKDSCLPSYDGPNDIRYLCENTQLGDLSDPLGALPVTDSVTGSTYKNYYCSICNNKVDNMVLWTPRLECPTVTLLSQNITQEYAFENLAFVGTSWGLYLTGIDGSLFFHDCDVDPVMPVLLESKIRLCKPDLVSDCPPNWRDEDTRTMCRSYMGARFIYGGDGFRNAHCALCNGENVTRLSCQSPEMKGFITVRKFGAHAFSLLLDINEGTGEEVGYVKMCDNGEVYDPFFKKCRSLVCLPGYMKRGGRCEPKEALEEESNDVLGSGESPTLVQSDIENFEGKENVYSTLVLYSPKSETVENISSSLQNVSGRSYNLSAMSGENLKDEISLLQNCLLISLADEDYVMLPNKSIYVPKYDKIYEPTSYHSADGSILVCSHLISEQDVKFMPPLGYMTIIGLGISMVCLFLHFVAFWIVPDLQNLSGKSLVSQCVSLFCAYACFIIGLFDDLGYTTCTVIAFFTFYFFQVAFFWMAAIAYDVWRTLKMATTELRVSTGKQIRRFLSYSFFSWITPLFIVGILALAEFTDVFPSPYRPGFASPRCWFKRRRSLLVFFAVPLIAIMLANVMLFISSSRMILMTTQTSVKQQSQAQRRNFKLYLRLALLMGLTWIVGIVAAYADVNVLWYLFVVFNTLQGLFIFIAFTCSTKVVKYLRDRVCKRSKTPEFKSTSHSASTGSGFHTNSTHLHSNIAKKFTSKLLLKQKDSTSTNNSTCSVHLHQTSSPI